jgi:hypothetical protein
MKMTLRFDSPGYIAEPYWPEMAELIDIQKKSGTNRCKSDSSRRKALEAHLDGLSMTYNDYLELEKLARRPFHSNGTGEIVIPAMRVLACMANATDVAPSAIRLCKVENIRSVVRATDLRTGKSKPDGEFKRFAPVKAAGGQALSNQRGLRVSQYIENFDGEGEIEYDPSTVSPEAVLRFLAYAGKEVGIGACRKMGFGRFVPTLGE